MPRPRFHRLDATKRKKILDVAAEEIAESGFERASYNRIIERAGLSKGAMYYYFDDKGDLYATVLRYLLNVDDIDLSWVDKLPDEPERLWLWVLEFSRHQLAFSLENPIVAAVGRDFAKRSPQVAALPAVAGLYADLDRMLEAVLAHGQRIGAVRTDLPTPLLLAVTLGAGEAMDRWFIDAMDGLDEETLDRLLVQSTDLLRRILMPTPLWPAEKG